ncbi:hypothetical protein H4582DRAFT_936448 [Lactarius indigo]|nr:hypothetical protein H4582DRAFT_936448 [Lactarius indigo]
MYSNPQALGFLIPKLYCRQRSSWRWSETHHPRHSYTLLPATETRPKTEPALLTIGSRSSANAGFQAFRIHSLRVSLQDAHLLSQAPPVSSSALDPFCWKLPWYYDTTDFQLCRKGVGGLQSLYHSPKLFSCARAVNALECAYGRLQCTSGLLVISGDDTLGAMPFYNSMRRVNEEHTSHRNRPVAMHAWKALIRSLRSLMHSPKATPFILTEHSQSGQAAT